MGKGKRKSGALIGILAASVILLALFWFFSALDGLRTGHSEESRQQLEDALRRAAVACYAAEGVYPPTVEYLSEHYGVQTDSDDYVIFYEIFADNLMPEITVVAAN